VGGAAGVHHGSGARQDREAQHKTVEAILAEAALANAQLAVARAVMQAEFRREGATAEEAATKAENAVEKMAQLVFGRVPAAAKERQRRGKPKVKVLYFRNLFEAEENDVTAMLPTRASPARRRGEGGPGKALPLSVLGRDKPLLAEGGDHPQLLQQT
jgi:hypothetical protein